ncbi:MAG: pyruvate dehydrogenase (acetyl-transferring) E1 component subunit alpha [Pseudomonadales bacterium]
MESVAQFTINYWQFLNADGQAVAELPAFTQDPERIISLYRAMSLTRLFDQKAIALQRTGQLGTYASPLGQEAIGVAIGSAMRPEDVLIPAYRDHAAQFMRGVRMTDILLYWGGDERGMDHAEAREDFPISVPVASQCCHAVGVAYAMRLRKQPRVAVCCIGDGGTSKGDFYESLNAAGVWQLPVIFVINNNHWAISVPRSGQSATQTLAQKAIAAGIHGEQVDGNDVIAMTARVAAAIERAQQGEASVIEALSYRMGDHTTADDASRYRSQEELDKYAARDPISRLNSWMRETGIWSEQHESALHEALAVQVDQAVKAYLATEPQSVQSMFDDLYETLPTAYKNQRDELVAAQTPPDGGTDHG